MNPLNDHPAARRVAYYVQFVVAGLVLLVGIGYGTAGVELPTFYAVTAAVTSGLWSYLGLTAAANVPSVRDVVEGDAPVPPELEAGTATLEALILAAPLLAGLVLLAGVLSLGS